MSRQQMSSADAAWLRMDRPTNLMVLGLISLTPAQIERRLIDLFASKSTLVLTNVPGPREPAVRASRCTSPARVSPE